MANVYEDSTYGHEITFYYLTNTNTLNIGVKCVIAYGLLYNVCNLFAFPQFGISSLSSSFFREVDSEL